MASSAAEMSSSSNSYRRGHRRYQSVMAEQFSSQLDDLFNMDSGLDTLVQDVESKRQSIFVQQRELEELQERIRRAEAQLGASSSEDEDSETSESDSPAPNTASKAPVQPTRARGNSYRQPSIFAIRETKDEDDLPKPAAKAPTAQPVSAVPVAGKEYVMVRRPRPTRKNNRVDSHIEISEEDEEEEEEEEEDDDEDDSSEESSEEEAQAPVRSPVRRR